MTNYNSPTGSVANTSPAPMNVLSVVGFVLSLVGFNVIAIILGAVGLSQIKRTGQRGRGFAIAAIVIGLVSIMIGVIIIIIAVIAAGTNNP
ncbi:DUF4190 domain-containing protein [Subtercola boreus]|uniref:DUF4190 domain-containing protein n=1 Tax=Subtercola boreus TaxID=120213 RepID=A0A3E0W896_9MICO|nr:DUF4190 domain-containing protein [Subtercola boreus]RFA17617.1 hypothetical protein B7R24_16830 [Subtercola boreus]RFA17641.1 hypothetical protein B7R23_16990 [Subtercola boreus]RFA24222.1 hypothetical protein B7R25_17145 [Subtercola boreus]